METENEFTWEEGGEPLSGLFPSVLRGMKLQGPHSPLGGHSVPEALRIEDYVFLP
jgi:hypothetical protein